MSVEEVHGRRIRVADRQDGSVGAKCDLEGVIPASCLVGRNNQLEVALIEPDLAVIARGGQSTIGRKCGTVDWAAIARIAEGLGPLLVTVIDAQTVPRTYPCRQIAAV